MMHLARWTFLGLALGALACGSDRHGVVVDADGDGIPADQDCDDSNALVWKTVRLHVDSDRDGHGGGEPVALCIGDSIPEGYAAVGDDCAPFDAAAWSGREAYLDFDGDGHGSGDPVLVCDGVPLLEGYAAVAGDCDETEASRWQVVSLYVDSDGDGIGSDDLVSACAGDTVPAGYSATSGDCAPEDGTRCQELPYLYRDADGDEYTTPEEGVACSGESLPAGYAEEPAGLDCDDANPHAYLTVKAYADVDWDGVGAGSAISLCTQGEIPVGYSQSESDCAPNDRAEWQMLGYSHIDWDGDGYTVPEVGTICAGWSLPTPFAATSRNEDCNDWDKKTWSLRTGYFDADWDGVGAGPAEEVCSGDSLPMGYLSRGDDCAPEDATRWRSYAYTYRDADGDDYGVPEIGAICTGFDPPAGYSVSVGRGRDCDDSSSSIFQAIVAYPDTDGDGVGAGQPTTFCTDGTGAIPDGDSLRGTDCASEDPDRWAMLEYVYVDRDGDGYTAREAAQICTGAALPDPYRAKANGNDCNDGDPALYQWVVLYQDKDGDGIGAQPRTVQCLADTLPAGWSVFGWDEDDSNQAVHWTGDEEDELLIVQP